MWRYAKIVMSLCWLTACVAPRTAEPQVDQGETYYRLKSKGVSAMGVTAGREYEIVPLSDIVDRETINRAVRHEKALDRVSWGIGILLFGTLLSAALKSWHLEAIGGFIALGGGFCIVHGIIMAKLMEWWPWVGFGAILLLCFLIMYLAHNKGLTLKLKGRSNG